MNERMDEFEAKILKYEKELADLEAGTHDLYDTFTYRSLRDIYMTSLNFWKERKKNYLLIDIYVKDKGFT